MSNQNFSKFLSKGISTPIGILIIVLISVIFVGILFWQYVEIQKEEASVPEIEFLKENFVWLMNF